MRKKKRQGVNTNAIRSIAWRIVFKCADHTAKIHLRSPHSPS